MTEGVVDRGPSGPPSAADGDAGSRSSRRERLRRVRRRRAFLALSLIATAEAVGTVGFHQIERLSWVNAFYFESMLATGQGPPFPLATVAGKLFASVMAFVSVGSTFSAVLFALGPVLARVWRELVEGVERKARDLEREVADGVRHLEEGER